jgi:microcystin degradation protein MlrC
MRLSRILLGHLHQESHSFNPIVMDRNNFAIAFRDDAISFCRGTNTVAGGVIDAANAARVAVSMPCAMHADSGGRVDHSVYVEFRSMMERAAREGGYDAIVLSLHGAMMTTELDDPEADLVRVLRSIAGEAMVLTCGLDLHAHVTEHTVRPCDFITAYRTNPHSDMHETGARLFRCTRDIVEQRFEPVCAYVHFPMLTLGRDRTDDYPLEGIIREARRAEQAGRVADVSIFTVQQFLDVPDMGQTILAYGNGSHEDALAVAMSVASQLWEKRAEMIATYLSLDEIISIAIEPERTRPVIVGDQGDRVVAGGTGDSPFILAHLIKHAPTLRALIPITDPDAVRKMAGLDVGSTVSVPVGGKLSGSYQPSILEAILVSRGDNADYLLQGPHGRGLKARTGPYAVLRRKGLHIVLTERPSSYVDPQNFIAFGLEPADQQLVVSRSGYHFTLNFAPIGDCLIADTPGITAYRPAELPFSVARPFYPVDDIPFEPATLVRKRATAHR